MINTALIGCGYWGSKLIKYIKGHGGFNLRYICNSRSSLDEVWSDKEVIAVVVATPTDTHYSLAKMALLHGNDVLVAKPLATEVVECKELKRIATDNQLVLLTDYTWTFSKGLQMAQGLVQKGKIGKVLGIEIVARQLGRFDSDNVYWLLGSHMLSVLDMFTPINDTWFDENGMVYYGHGCETGTITFLNSDVSGHITVSLNYPGKETKVMIYGENGTIVYDAMSQPSLRVEKYNRTAGPRLQSAQMPYHTDESNNLRYMVEHFYKAIGGEAEDNIDRAMEVTRILRMLVE